MVDQPENRVDPRITASRHRVLTAALTELAEAGYGGFAIESVCRRSGVAKSTVYRHWPGKLALIADALRSLNVQPGSADDPLSDRTPRQRVVAIVGHLATAFTGSLVADCTPALIDAAERNDELRELFHRYNAERRATLVAAVRDGISAGDFPPGADPELAATALAGAVIYRRLMTPEALDPTEVEDLVETVLGPGASQSPSPRRRLGEATRE